MVFEADFLIPGEARLSIEKKYIERIRIEKSTLVSRHKNNMKMRKYAQKCHKKEKVPSVIAIFNKFLQQVGV